MDKEVSPIIVYPIICSIIGAVIGIVTLFVFGFTHWTPIVRIVVVAGLVIVGLLIGFLIGDAARKHK